MVMLDIEIYIVENEGIMFHTATGKVSFEEDRITVKSTRLLNKFAIIGNKAYLSYKTFVLPVRVVGKSEDRVIFSLPNLNVERPIGERKHARVLNSKKKPVKLFLSLPDGEREFIPHDVSEGGLSVEVEDTSEVDSFLKGKEFPFRLEMPIQETPEVAGTLKLTNILEMQDRVRLGFELFMEDADMVKLRFYIYNRIKEMLSEE